MSNYTSTFADAVVASSPVYYYPMDEAVNPGGGSPPTMFADRMNRHPLNIDGTGTLNRGLASLLPGDPSGACVGQDKEFPIASRANNALYDPTGSTFTRIALMCVFKLDKIKSTPQRLISKYNSYALWVNKTSLVMSVQGQSDLSSNNDVVVPSNTMMVVAVFDPPNAKQQLWLNGGLIASRTISTGLTVTSSSNEFRAGGVTEVGPYGISGSIQHIVSWHPSFGVTGTPPSDTTIRNFYELGVSDQAEQLGEALNVMPWSRQAFAANPNRKYIILSNDSDVEIYLALRDSNALSSAGLRIPPNEWRKLDGYKGAGSAIHKTGTFGAKRLTVTEVEE